MMEEPLTWNIILKTFLIRRNPRVLIVKKKKTNPFLGLSPRCSNAVDIRYISRPWERV